MHTWTLVANHRIFAIFACLKECGLKFGSFPVGNVGHTLAFPNHTAAHLLHIGREYHFPACFVEECHHFVHKVGLWSLVSFTHGLVEATWEINHLFL